MRIIWEADGLETDVPVGVSAAAAPKATLAKRCAMRWTAQHPRQLVNAAPVCRAPNSVVIASALLAVLSSKRRYNATGPNTQYPVESAASPTSHNALRTAKASRWQERRIIRQKRMT